MPIQQVAQGGVVTLTGKYENAAGDLLDPTTPLVDIVDADDVERVTDDSPTRDSLGLYSYIFTVPVDGPIGRWAAHFTGVIDGLLAGADDEFDVVAPGTIVTSTYDLLTLAEGKAALNIDSAVTTFDTEVAAYITALSQRIDDMCGPVVKRSVSAEHHDGGYGVIWPHVSPVATVGTVLEYSSGVSTTLTGESLTVAGDFVLLDGGTHNSRLSRRSSFSDRTWGTAGPVVISYVAGRFDSTAAVSAKFKQAAAKLLTGLWQNDQGAGTATFGATEGTALFGPRWDLVVEMLALERRPPVIA